jgi:hypothetical protein
MRQLYNFTMSIADTCQSSTWANYCHLQFSRTWFSFQITLTRTCRAIWIVEDHAPQGARGAAISLLKMTFLDVFCVPLVKLPELCYLPYSVYGESHRARNRSHPLRHICIYRHAWFKTTWTVRYQSRDCQMEYSSQLGWTHWASAIDVKHSSVFRGTWWSVKFRNGRIRVAFWTEENLTL